jgi:hypothetical protein
MTLSHKRKERLRRQRNQSIRWFIYDTAAMLFVAATLYTVGVLLFGLADLL